MLLVLKEEKPTAVEGTLSSQRSHFMATSLLIVPVFVGFIPTPSRTLGICSARPKLATGCQQQAKNLPPGDSLLLPRQTGYLQLGTVQGREDPCLCYNLTQKERHAG